VTKLNLINPPSELVKQWIDEPQYITEEQLGKRVNMVSMNEVKFLKIINKASQYGADQELEACCEWLDNEIGASDPNDLRADRRPKPPSLKSEAIAELENMVNVAKAFGFGGTNPTAIRRALETLPE
jgi:hypothetical protein